jgi:hypothetical protein
MVNAGAGVLLSVFFELLLEVVDEDGETPCSVSGRSNNGDELVAGWPKTSRRGENKSGGNVELESKRDLAMAAPREGFPFYSSTERNGHPNRLR